MENIEKEHIVITQAQLIELYVNFDCKSYIQRMTDSGEYRVIEIDPLDWGFEIPISPQSPLE